MKVTANGKTFTFPDGTSTEDIAPEVAKKIATSESMGVTPMTSDVIPPKNAFTRGLTQDAEGALLGTGSKRAEQYATRSKLVSNYFDRFGEYNPDDVVKSLTTTLRGRKDAAGAVINDVTNKMGNAAVDTTNTMNALNTAIARQERLGTSANQSLLTSLRIHRLTMLVIMDLILLSGADSHQ